MSVERVSVMMTLMAGISGELLQIDSMCLSANIKAFSNGSSPLLWTRHCAKPFHV